MILNGEAYSRRLKEFSDSTAKLISEVMPISRETLRETNKIIANSEFSEEQVVAKLKELKKSYSMTKETK